jgi:hypothetical protein
MGNEEKQAPNPIPKDVWDRAARMVLKDIRAETGIPSWLPKLLNGRSEFERRVMAIVRGADKAR